MKTGTIATLAVVATSLCPFVHADFKYTQQSKMTGGSLLTMTKTLGVFSKNMRQANEPQNSTVMVKGNRLRNEHANGSVEIIDLDQRRFVYIDTQKKTYSIVTFDEFKAAMQRAQERAREEQAKEEHKRTDQNVKITPKFQADATGASRDILGNKANEMKMRMEMQVDSTDPEAQQKAQSGAFVIDSDAWLAPSVDGYDEVRDFHLKLAKELDWYPSMLGATFGMNNPKMQPAMLEFRKNAEKVKGMPMLQYVSIGASGTGTAESQTESSRASARPESDSSDNAIPTSPSQAVMKGLGGMFGHKKKKEQEQQQEASATENNGQPRTTTASLIEMTTEVTSISSSTLDKSLFDVPAGYTQVQRNADEAFGGKR